MLILQGERDYQVTMTDFAGWQKALFVVAAGKSKPREYQTEGHVAQEAIDDMAAWVKKR